MPPLSYLFFPGYSRLQKERTDAAHGLFNSGHCGQPLGYPGNQQQEGPAADNSPKPLPRAVFLQLQLKSASRSVVPRGDAWEKYFKEGHADEPGTVLRLWDLRIWCTLCDVSASHLLNVLQGFVLLFLSPEQLWSGSMQILRGCTERKTLNA